MALTTSQYKVQFMASEQAAEIKEELDRMVEDPMYNTRDSYSPFQDDVTFTEKHLDYLSSHPNVKPYEYLSNLRLMTKLKR